MTTDAVQNEPADRGGAGRPGKAGEGGDAGSEADNQISNSGVNWFGKLFGGKGAKP